MTTPYVLAYVCSNGHETYAYDPLARCPHVVGGMPCDGEMQRVGRGAKAAKS